MHLLDVEHRSIRSASLAKTLAHALLEDTHNGKVVIVTDSPTAMLSAVRKQWLLLERRTLSKRAATLRAAKILELSEQLSFMRGMRFSTKQATDQLEANITFATTDNLLRVPPECRTMYVTYSFPKEKLHMITSWMPPHGLVVVYDA